MNNNLLYTGGRIEHPESEESGVRIEFTKGLQPIELNAGTNEAVASYLANQLITARVHADNFESLPEWELFNACSIDVRLRAFALMQQISERVTTEIADDQTYVQEQMANVLSYVSQHQVAPSTADVQELVQSLILFNRQSAADFEETLSDPYDLSKVDWTDLDMKILKELSITLVSVAYAAGVSSADLFAMYRQECTARKEIVWLTLPMLKARLKDDLGINDPEW